MENLNCCVCFRNESTAVSVTQIYRRKQSILFYLEQFAAEINWKDSFMICSSCLKKLNIVIEFRRLCLKSNSCRLKKPKRIEISSDYDGENVLTHADTEDEDNENLESTQNKILKVSNQIRGRVLTRKFRCAKCGRSYMRDKYMKKHLKICDGIMRHSKLHFLGQLQQNSCSKCLKCYSTKKILGDHIKTCGLGKGEVENKKCYSCDIMLENRKKKHEHVLNVHKVDIEVPNTCAFCYKIFEIGSEYEEHLKICLNNSTNNTQKHLRKSKISCNVCLEEFTSADDVVNHCQKMHQLEEKLVKPYSCNQCRSCFSQKAYLIRHMSCHNETKNQICTICGKTFTSRSYLKAHEIIHKNKRSFKCGDCDKAFRTHNNLLCHRLVVHTDPSLWKYSCEFCKKRFAVKSSHDQHRRRHINDRQFSCILCGKSFISKRELNKHSRTHTKMPGFECNRCGEGFNIKKKFNSHLLTCVLGKNRIDDDLLKNVLDASYNQIEVIELTKDEVQALKRS